MPPTIDRAQRWMLYAIDKRTGKIRLGANGAPEGEPRNKRHIKSTYASGSPATDGRIVVAWFGSQGIYAYDLDGGLRWSVDLGRVDMGAYDIPSYEWGPASSPIIWNGLVIVQCDTQTDSFLLALNAETGETVWKTDRQELPSWGTPTMVDTAAGPELVTNASNFVRGYDPRPARELWHLGGSSKITAPTPIFANGLHIVASGARRAAGVRGAARSARRSDARRGATRKRTWPGARPAAARTCRRRSRTAASCTCWPTTACSMRTTSRPARRSIASACRSSAADTARHRSPRTERSICRTKTARCWSSRPGATFKHLATNTIGETLMATPALSEGVMYVRGARTLFAIGKKK